MSDGFSLKETAVSSTADELSSPVSAGALLRAAREAAGLHVAALAVAIKVPVKKLEALEADRLDLLPDAVFVRALASSVCRNLKIDPAPVLSRLPHQHAPRLGVSERDINAPFHAAGENRSLAVPAALKQPVALLVFLLLVAALVVSFLPEWQTEAPSELISAPSAPVLIVPTTSNSLPEIAPPLGADAVVPSVMAAVSSPTASAVAFPAATISDTTPAPAAKSDSGPSIAPAAESQVVFRVSGPSWVEVTDAKGVVLLRRNLVEGDSAGTSGALPLSVIVGRADVTQVEIKGKPFNLAAIAKDNVARFEVK
jgi:cytoskeleton protein RodZ